MAGRTLGRSWCALGTLWLCACSDLSGEWEGDCDYEAPSGDREVRIVVTLDELSDKGLGEGSGKVIEDGDPVKADVVYQIKDDSILLDIYPDKGKDLFLRGSIRNKSLVGACGDEAPTTVNVEGMLSCASGLDIGCEEADEWQQGKRPAPVTDDDLSGRFSLDRP